MGITGEQGKRFAKSVHLVWTNDPHTTYVKAGIDTNGTYTPYVSGGNNIKDDTIGKLNPQSCYNFYIENSNDRVHLYASTFSGSAQTFTTQRQKNCVTPDLQKAVEFIEISEQTFDILLPHQNTLLHYTWEHTLTSGRSLSLQDILKLPIGLVQDTDVALLQNWHEPDVLEAMARISTGDGNDTLTAFQFTPGANNVTSFPVNYDGPIDHVTGSPALIQNDQAMFALLVPRHGVIDHFTHTSLTFDGLWLYASTLPPINGGNVISIALAQTDGEGGMVAVARVQEASNVQRVANVQGFSNTNFLVSYTYVADKGWQEPILVNIDNAPVVGVIGTPALLTSNTSEGQERLELLVPTTEGLKHLINAPDAPANTWQLVAVLEPLNEDRAITPVVASLVQTEPGKLQAFVRAETSDGQFLLITYSYDRATNSWSGPAELQVPDAPDGGNGNGGGEDGEDDETTIEVITIVEEDKRSGEVIGIEVITVIEERDETIVEVVEVVEEEDETDR